MNFQAPRGLLYALFALSGFAGLIYESIWSHYLKLLLGHAAYAQTVVLMIFMGGMAIGAWMAGNWSYRVTRPLLWYVGVEAALGIAALTFDPFFRMAQGWLFDSVIVGLDSGLAVDVVKWSMAVMLALPQAILLGATFPLISAGLIRMFPSAPGNALSWLYFTNSLGAAAGVLASGFYLVGLVGLPGTILTAGLINFALAIAVYALERSSPAPPRLAAVQRDDSTGNGIAGAMLLTAALTGGASFMYEIGWIRMLSLVLGSATHSFELMLSAFILGLSLGAFYIRKRIDDSADLLRLLGWIQVVMALLALISLPLYMQTFDAMAAAYAALSPNLLGYIGFTLFSHLVCLVLMLPVTFCAGMTLPLITAFLLRVGYGESSIGRVYAANTLGSIAGVLIAVHLVMPLAGLRWVVVGGALVDLALGVWLLLKGGAVLAWRDRLIIATSLGAAATLTLFFSELDPRRTASGVFRHGQATVDGSVIFHRDGKTATVDVIREANGYMAIATNGKIDASLSIEGTSIDDYTMVLLGLMPMSMLPEATEVAVIGMGSGRTVHAMLHNPQLERVDVVEIEPAMVEGAHHFGKWVERTYSDPRSHIHIDDAKTYFARNRRQYDIVVSEPSNPWVSGVATLFSVEFYKQIQQYIRPGGLFVQWLQLYEIDAQLMSTVFNAIGSEFEDYRVFYANDGDLMIIASKDGKVPSLGDWVLKDASLAPLLGELRIHSLVDLEYRDLGSAATLEPFFESWGVPANSDYFPILDQGAAKRRFMRRDASELAYVFPYSYRLEDRLELSGLKDVQGAPWYANTVIQALSIDTYFEVAREQRGLRPEMGSGVIGLLDDLRPQGIGCTELGLRHNWLRTIKTIAKDYGPYLAPATGRAIAEEILTAPCKPSLSPEMQDWLNFLQAQTARDWPEIRRLAAKLLEVGGAQSLDVDFLLAEGMLASLKSGGRESAIEFAGRFTMYPRRGMPWRYLESNVR